MNNNPLLSSLDASAVNPPPQKNKNRPREHPAACLHFTKIRKTSYFLIPMIASFAAFATRNFTTFFFGTITS